jgi:hypothetical protein
MSATYEIFRQMFLTGEVRARSASHASIPVHAALIGTSYSFNPAHDSYAAHVAPHVVADLNAPPIPYDPRDYKLPPAVYANAPYGGLTPSGATVVAIVIWSLVAGTPWFYLDSETFPSLPAVTLGGAVEYSGAGGVAVVG